MIPFYIGSHSEIDSTSHYDSSPHCGLDSTSHYDSSSTEHTFLCHEHCKHATWRLPGDSDSRNKSTEIQPQTKTRQHSMPLLPIRVVQSNSMIFPKNALN
jgi:hypothetical protein